jgi:hypothetical protein
VLRCSWRTCSRRFSSACGRRRSVAIDSQFQPARKRILLQRSSSTVQCTHRHHSTSISANSNRVVRRAIVELWLGSVPWAGHLCREVEERALHSPRGILGLGVGASDWNCTSLAVPFLQTQCVGGPMMKLGILRHASTHKSP